MACSSSFLGGCYPPLLQECEPGEEAGCPAGMECVVRDPKFSIAAGYLCATPCTVDADCPGHRCGLECKPDDYCGIVSQCE